MVKLDAWGQKVYFHQMHIYFLSGFPCCLIEMGHLSVS